MAKLILDAGHGGADPGAVHNGRQEKDDVLRLALAVGERLEKNGVEVAYTRTEDVYDSPFEKAQIANRGGGDFFVSFHRNSSPEPNQYSGVETLVYDQEGQKIALAETINSALERVGFRNLGVQERPGLVVLRKTGMPAVLVEAGFLNTDADNERFDLQFDDIAQAIADGILRFLGVGSADRPSEDAVIVSTGNAAMSSAGDTAMSSVGDTALGLVSDAAIGPAGDAASLFGGEREEDVQDEDSGEKLYRVQVGAFRRLDDAVRLERQLRVQGYATFITT